MHELLLTIVGELKGSWRFRWIAMATTWVVCLIGWAAVFGLPDTYESEAVVYVDTTSALRPILNQLTVDSDVLSRVEQVTTAMLGRPQLEKVAIETDLHLRAGTRQEMDRLIVQMRQNTSIKSARRRGDANIYTISYSDHSPRVAQAVVSTMLNTFVEDSLGANRLDTQKAQEFLRMQIDELGAELTESEESLAEFKKKNVGRMPGEGGGYFTRLQTEMELLEETRGNLRLANRRKESLQAQLAGDSTALSTAGGPQSELAMRIAENERRLEELQLRFTDLHPDVVAVVSTLEQLRAQQRKELDELRNSPGTVIASDNPVYQNIQIELSNSNAEIAALREKESTHIQKVAELRGLVDILPEVEAELSRLTRDYNVKQTQYQNLLGRLEIAELSEEADLSDDVNFRIIDPPLLPDAPVAPNRTALLAVVLVIGLGAGAGLAVLGNQLKPVFSDPATLRRIAELPVLGCVSAMRSEEHRRQRVAQIGTFSGALVALCVVFLLVFLFQDAGTRLVQSLI